MIKILSGEMAIELHLQFLIRNNNTDLMILKNTKVNQVNANTRTNCTAGSHSTTWSSNT